MNTVHDKIVMAFKIWLKGHGFQIKKLRYNEFSIPNRLDRDSDKSHSNYCPDIVAYFGIEKYIFEIVVSHLSQKIFYNFKDLNQHRKIVVTPTDKFYDAINNKTIVKLDELEGCFDLFEIKKI